MRVHLLGVFLLSFSEIVVVDILDRISDDPYASDIHEFKAIFWSIFNSLSMSLYIF